MSGIYIPGVEMPKSCRGCPCEYDGYCQLIEDGEYYKVGRRGRRETCPLVPVPDHGRLVDADALYEKFLRLESESMSALQTTSIGSADGIKWSAILTERTGYKFDIVDAPTIIPASGGTENVDS